MARAERRFAFKPRQICLCLATLLAAPCQAFAQAPPPLPGTVGVPAGGGAPIGTGAPEREQRDGIFYGIRSSVLVSNNLNYLPEGQNNRGNFLFELAPYVQARFDNHRGIGYASYTMRGQYSETSADLRHDLRAWGNIKLTDEMFRLAFQASIFDVNTTPFGVTSNDPGAQSTNTTQYKNFELSPYASGRFDGGGNWTARYRLRYNDPGNGNTPGAVPSNVFHSLSGGLRTDLSRRRVGFSLNGNLYQTEYSSGYNYSGSDADALAWWSLPQWNLRLAAGVGYAQNSRLKNDNGENSGIGPSAAFDWAPNSRSFIRGRWSQRFYGPAIDFSANHRASQWTFTVAYNKGIADGNISNGYGSGQGDVFSRNAGNPFAPGGFGNSTSSMATNPVAQGLADRNLLWGGGGLASLGSATSLLGSNLLMGTGLSTSAIVYYESLTATAGFVGSRSGVLASVFINNRRTALPFTSGYYEDLDQYGAALGATYRLDQVNSINAMLRHTVSDSTSPQVSHANLTSLITTYDWRITPRSTLTVGGRLQHQDGSGTTVSYNEAAAFVAIDYRFHQ